MGFSGFFLFFFFRFRFRMLQRGKLEGRGRGRKEEGGRRKEAIVEEILGRSLDRARL